MNTTTTTSNEVSAAQFIPTCFARTNAGWLMPVRYAANQPAGDDFAAMQAKSGRVYTVKTSRIITVEQAKATLLAERTRRVAASYTFKVVSEAPLAVIASNPTEPARTYVLAFGEFGATCTCGAYHREAVPCKHIRGYADSPDVPATPALPAPAEAKPVVRRRNPLATFKPAPEPVTTTTATSRANAVPGEAIEPCNW